MKLFKNRSNRNTVDSEYGNILNQYSIEAANMSDEQLKEEYSSINASKLPYAEKLIRHRTFRAEIEKRNLNTKKEWYHS